MAKQSNINNPFYGHAITAVFDDSRNTLAVDTEGNSYKNITVAEVCRLANAAGVLAGISLNTNGNTVTVYDNTVNSGTKIGVIAADAPEGMYLTGLSFLTGLTVETGGTIDVTVVYRSVGSTLVVGSVSPSLSPSLSPSFSPSLSPSVSPSVSPSLSPSISPSLSPSVSPSVSPSLSPSISPSVSPST